ncbi:E3 ubiquitin-protein ligase TRIM71-like [Mercenaria mercenaria]|uniref:E3 ubiquitin-protein ligase TRIM71-like n=1 Tax=Mercenaria mercenaria TaxID=6596 RepID=UPI00234E3B82|nr:E3 ubiquitin-protein ligase TRIM71-like [Mercenaria mercenaria]
MDNEIVTNVTVDEGAVGVIHSNESYEETGNENFQCEPCLFENAEVEATTFCMDCFEHLCINCARDHRKNKISRNHKLLEGEEIPKDLKTIKILKRMMACSGHPGTDVTYKCEDHDKYICVTCLAECHRKCNEVNEISLIISPGNEDRCRIVKESLSQLQEYTATSKSASEDNKESLRAQLSVIQKEQQTLFDSIYEELSKRKKQLELETGELATKELTEIEGNLQKYNEAETEEEEYQRLLDVTIKCGNAREVNVIPDLISRKVKLLKEAIENRYKKEQAFLTFNCSVDLKPLIKLGQVSVMYTDQVKHLDSNDEHRLSSDELLEPEKVSNKVTKLTTDNSSSQSSITKHLDEIPQTLKQTRLSAEREVQSTPNTQQKSHPPSFMKRSVGHQFISYSVKCQDDPFYCRICAIVILPDDRLVILDHTNTKLKVFKEDFSLAFTFGFQNKPFAMCHAYDNTVAVVLIDGRAVDKYFIGHSNVFNAGKFPTKYGIDALEKFGNDKKIAILFCDDKEHNRCHFFQIRDAEHGRILETLYLEKSTGVTLKLEGAKRMLYRGTNEIFVSEHWKLHCFDIDKNVGFCTKQSDSNYIQESWFYKSCKGHFLKDVSDLATDEEGNIYVCGLESNNIHQISSDNYRENRIILNNIKEPNSISVHSKKGYLIVGCFDDDYIHVYHFG